MMKVQNLSMMKRGMQILKIKLLVSLEVPENLTNEMDKVEKISMWGRALAKIREKNLRKALRW